MTATLIALLTKMSILLACHFVGDYALQNAWMAMTKGKDWHAMFAHVGTYTSVFALLNLVPDVHLNLWALILILGSHAFIDPIKARWNLIGDVSDQLLHIGILLFCVLKGWI
ncbi:hypothetical protein A2239_00260 [Candidatus Uhrbacteria bacterium RIFOXYA2_FULL_40_9]|nr:MAG: hypothetical protein UT94_C0034G0013 [Candidatus Uhrbacteria bacterium GW2011_GWF2_40_263]OGL93852.1 MAG: hypothetical protein A2239_00260 [Candidatus Uhrbacteria bacterium RIFOXYA2_FULL_40_9]OGL97561.1 MAG: hypothetical protein A2332_03435 [Candidatus Uhrbacteria bacterium RIFOXYB2_FULL_41_18]HBK34409.1 hypothetical protein [Candidatus Uhrbacteria bacterium]HCB55775.1 hypothetical protein [Candidatus Uhrbacteria bacterium]